MEYVGTYELWLFLFLNLNNWNEGFIKHVFISY